MISLFPYVPNGTKYSAGLIDNLLNLMKYRYFQQLIHYKYMILLDKHNKHRRLCKI